MRWFTLALLSILTFNAQAISPPAKLLQDRVSIQPRKIVVVRSPKIARQFPDRKTAVVTYPLITGLNNPAVLRRVRSTLDFKNIFGYSLADYKDDAWLSEFGYTVNFNRDYMLDITFTQNGLAAYPDEHYKHFLIDLRNGNTVKASDVFEANKLGSLADLVDNELQHEIRQLAKDNLASADADQKESLSGAYDDLRFEMQNLDTFSVGPKGVTFLYDAGFPRVLKALEPRGSYFFTYAALRDYIKGDGLLAKFRG